MCAKRWILQMFPPSGFIFPESPHPAFANRREKNGVETSIYHQSGGLATLQAPPPVRGEDGSVYMEVKNTRQSKG